MNLEILNKQIGDCTKCQLRETATAPVCGLGEVGAKYLIIGEAPGENEDKVGCPFVGLAGKRLQKLLDLAGISENDCYITNVIKCRPPKNRDPRKGEIKACSEWLAREIEAVKPKIIIVLGRIPTGLFSKHGIRQLHGTSIDYKWNGQDVQVIFQYHPAAALHAPRLWAQMLDDWEHLPKKVDSDFTVIKRKPTKFPDLIALDTENAPDGSLGQWSIAYRNGNGKLCVLPFYGSLKCTLSEMAETQICMHNAKWDLRVLKANKIKPPGNVLDTMIMAYCLGLGKQDVRADATYTDTGMIGGLGLKYLARRHLGMEMSTWDEIKDKPDEIPEYNAKDSVATLLLAERWLPQLPQHFWDIDMPLLGTLMAIEDRGIAIDPKYLSKFVKELDAALEGIDLPVDPFSPKQLIKHFYEEKGYQPTKFTGTGQPSVTKEILETFNDPVAEKIIQYKGLHQDRQTYVENYIKRAGSDGRIHAEFKQVSTATGRLSCANPNLQNVPKRDDVRAEMRRLFVAPRGKVLIRADFDQLELRVFAALTGEERMAEIFKKGGDIHQMTADALGIDRYTAKTINFLMLYGGGAWKISEEFHIPIDKARTYIQKYFEMFPGIIKYYEETLTAAKETKKVVNWAGRERRMDALYAEDWRVRKQGEREAINTPIQGGAGEVVKLAMNDLHYKHKAPMILQVHDELIFEVDAKDGKEYARWIKMYIPTLTTINGIRFPVDVSIGQNWHDMEGV